MMTTTIPKFFLQRKGEKFTMIFPVPQRHRVNTYRKSPRRSYQVLEPVHTPWLVLPVGKETAKGIGQALKENRLSGDVEFTANDDWQMVITGEYNE